MSSNRVPTIAKAAIFGLAYYGAVRVGLLFSFPPSEIAAFWPAAGLAFTVYLLSDTRHWPLYAVPQAIAVLVGNYQNGVPLDANLGFVVANGIEPVVAAYFFRRVFKTAPTLSSIKGVLKVISAGVVIGPIAGSLLGAAVVVGVLETPVTYLSVLRQWGFSDAIGVLAVAPLLLALAEQRKLTFERRQTLAYGISLLLLSGTILAAFMQTETSVLAPSAPYLVVPPILLITLSFRQLEIALAVSVTAFLTIWLTANGHGPWTANSPSVTDSVLNVQAFIAVLALATLLPGALRLSLRRTAKLHNSIIQTNRDAFISVDRDLKVIDWNMAAEELLGWSKQRILGKAVTDTVLTEHRFKELGHQEELSGSFETEATRNDGTKISVELTVSPLEFEGTYSLNLFLRSIEERKQASASLIRAESQLRASFQQSALAMFIVGLDHRLINSNSEFTALTSYSQAVQQQEPLYSLLSNTHYREVVMKLDSMLVENHPQSMHYECSLLAADSEEIECLLHANLVRDEESRPLHFIFQVQDLRKERSLERENDRFWQDSLELLATLDLSGVIQRANPYWQTVLGYENSQLIGRSIVSLAEDSSLEQLSIAVHQVTTGAANSTDYECRVKHIDGHYRWLHFTFKVDQLLKVIFVTARDITYRKHSEQTISVQLAAASTLASAQNTDEALYESIDSVGKALGADRATYWSFDQQSKKLSYELAWNQTDGILKGKTGLQLEIDEEYSENPAHYAWQQGKTVQADDFYENSPTLNQSISDEHSEHRNCIAVPLRSSSMGIGVVEFYGDQVDFYDKSLLSSLDNTAKLITEFLERKYTEQEIEDLKDQFLALVSHELRTPLTSIIGYLEILQEENTALPAEAEGFVDIINRNARRLQRLVGDLLFTAKLNSGTLDLQKDEVDPKELVEASIDRFQPLLDANSIDVTANLEEVSHVSADYDRLSQVVDNLISNAVKFSPEGSSLYLTVTENRGRLNISVKDTGYGIPEEDQPHIFDRFYRSPIATEKVIAGAGIGLAVTKSIVEAHGGSISFTSEQRWGTVFVVDLPVVDHVDSLNYQGYIDK